MGLVRQVRQIFIWAGNFKPKIEPLVENVARLTHLTHPSYPSDLTDRCTTETLITTDINTKRHAHWCGRASFLGAAPPGFPDGTLTCACDARA